MYEELTVLEAARAALGVTDTYYDMDIELAIEAAKIKMQLAGVSEACATDTGDPLVRVAIIAFVKGTVGNDNPDAERYLESFESMVTQMKLTRRYTQEVEHGEVAEDV